MTAVLACKLCRALIRLLGRGGTDFPGRVALKLCPNLLGELARNVTTVIVTGTNGKTTTSRMIEQSWQDAGISYFANKSGANLLSGTRAEDMALRFLYAGFPREKLHVQKDYGKLMEEATAHKLPVFVMPTYTAMLALRGTISKTYGYKQFWE